MINEYVYIDLDGVILDSEHRMLQRKEMIGFHNHHDKQEFSKYFEYTQLHPSEWNYIIKEANSLNNSVEIIRKLEKMKKKIAILTKIHTLYEMKVKIEDLRNNRKIGCPVLFVPPGVKKCDIVIPNGQILVDDSQKNIKDWIEHGGKGFIYDEKANNDTFSKVRSLDFLLKR